MKKINLLIAMIVLSQAIYSQIDSTSKGTFSISGSVDAYYRYDFNNPKSHPYNSLTSFTRSSNSFELGMASVRLDHSIGKVSATIDLGFGTRAEEFAYNDAGTRLAIKQLFLSYAPSSSLKFTLGSWSTHVGYELLDPWLNRNYSMSYMFTNGPFSHTGIKADVALEGKSSFMIGIANPTDFRSAPTMPKSLIAQFSTGSNDDKLKAYFNFVAGKQTDYKKIAQADIVGTYAVSSQFSIGINGTLQSAKLDADSVGKFTSYNWSGVALYLNYDPVNWLGLTLRSEYISDNDNYLGLKSVIAPTLSANFKINNLTVIPEFRLDKADNEVFMKNTNEPTTTTGNFLLAVAYHF